MRRPATATAQQMKGQFSMIRIQDAQYEVQRFCREKGIWLIEDNCDALGSRYDGQLTGTFGDLSTQSFYPPHHLTMGEGGAVSIVRHPPLKSIVESFRDWGRDCWCASGIDKKDVHSSLANLVAPALTIKRTAFEISF